MNSADAFCFSLMLACCAAFIATKYRYGFIISILPLVFSLGIYQAYYSVTIGLLIISLILEILYNDISWKEIIIKGIKYLILLGASMVLYLLIVNITTTDTGLSSYMGLDQIGQVTLNDIPYMIKSAYKSIISYYLINGRDVHYPFLGIAFIASFFACGFLLVRKIIQDKIHYRPINLILLIILVFLLPLGCNIVYLFNPQVVHLLMIYGTVLICVFLLSIEGLVSKELKIVKTQLISFITSLSCWVIIITIMLSIFSNWIMTNKAYFKLAMGYEQAYAQSVVLISQIQGTEGYTFDKEIILVGKPYKGIEYYQRPFPQLDEIQMTGILSVDLFGNILSYDKFLSRFLGLTQPVTHIRDGMVKDDEIAAILKDMPQYPNSGSISIIDDKIIVKFSYNTNNK